MTTVTLTAKNQITLRKAFVEALGARPGDKLEVEVRPEGLLIAPRRRGTKTWDDLAGMLKRPADVPPLSMDEMNEVIAKGWAGELDDNG